MSREKVLKEALAELHDLVGLHEVKRSIEALMIEMKGREKARAFHDRKNDRTSYHMMLSGDAGTGKTVVARIISKIMYGAGISRTDQFLEVDRADLVGQFVGETAQKTKRLIEKARGGVLFIDEAYALVGSGQDFGQEAINILIKAMEDERDDLIIIFAGYRAEMRELLRMNEGFRSRIPYHFVFPNYTPSELAQIIVRILRSRDFDCFDILRPLKDAVTRAVRQGSVEGNGRWARNQAEKIIKAHYTRLGKEEEDAKPFALTTKEIDATFHNELTGRNEDVDGLQAIAEEAYDELHQLIGLGDLKKRVTRLMRWIAIEHERMNAGLHHQPLVMHMTFTGPPGTGKTTVARIIGKYLYGLGMLSSSTFIEADRSDLVGRYIGETEEKTMKLIERADGGILFIDEAYALAGDGNDFGRQAIDTLIKEMEERKHRMVVILAGYTNEMAMLYEMNPGLRSRVPYTIEFPAYRATELVEMMKLQLAKEAFTWDEAAERTMVEKVTRAYKQGAVEGNGRWVRNQVDRLRVAQSNRLFMEKKKNDYLEDEWKEQLQRITAADIQQAFQ